METDGANPQLISTPEGRIIMERAERRKEKSRKRGRVKTAK